MAASISLQSQQNQSVVEAVGLGKTIAIQISPGGGFVWPHLTANSVPIFRGQLSRRQVQAIIDHTAAGKTAAINFSSGTGRNHIDFT